MIPADMLAPALKALQRLIVQAKIQAVEGTGEGLAQFLDDFELIPEYLADDADRTEELIATFRGLAQMDPSCRRIVDEFDRSTPLTTRDGK